MAKNLVIVESPSKAVTIKKILGKDYDVIASVGHVRDLPKSKLGIDVDNDYEPQYITIRGKQEVISNLRKSAKKADMIYLATDPDREGEAISWHLAQLLKLDKAKYRRITFNEITKKAIKNAFKESRDLDMNLVDAQQARRVLDRLVGYGISPLLWDKIKRGLSAGRVQSVALRMIAERESIIDAFVPEEYWYIDAAFSGNKKNEILSARYFGKNGKKSEVKSEKEADEIKEKVLNSTFVVSDIKKSEKKKNSPLPFTTSTLQQEAARMLNFSTSKTMSVAQQLYEGVEVKGKGQIGLITYLRTDSTRISEEAEAAVKEFIKAAYGENFVLKGEKSNLPKRKIQDAHEAIRPVNVELQPDMIKDSLSREQYKLYQLIWKRFIASRMEQAVYEVTSVKLQADGYVFSAGASKLKFDGFMSVYKVADENGTSDEESGTNKNLEWLEKGKELKASDIKTEQHFTQPPAHFNEGSLVRELEEKGIGRPSTYAPTITTIIARHYVSKESKNLFITDLGEAVNDVMVKWFSKIVDYGFTANMESELDHVEEGGIEWNKVVREFYPEFQNSLKIAEEEIKDIKYKDKETDVICEKCGRNMVIRYHGASRFLACPGYPDCKNTKSIIETIDVKCPKCQTGDITIMRTKNKKRFYGCSNYPECDFVSWQRPQNK